MMLCSVLFISAALFAAGCVQQYLDGYFKTSAMFAVACITSLIDYAIEKSKQVNKPKGNRQ